MTAPVVMTVEPVEEGKYTVHMSFYIPDKYQGKAPQPTEDGVYLEQVQALNVYVRLVIILLCYL